MQGIKSFFPELSSCLCGTPSVETIVSEAPGSRRRRIRQRNSRKHWRPALTAIEEDGESRRKSAQSTNGFRSEKNLLIKSKLAGNNRSDSYYGYEYR